jgi:hypothetical protein
MDIHYYILWDLVADLPMRPFGWSRIPKAGYRRVFGQLVGNFFSFDHNGQHYELDLRG